MDNTKTTIPVQVRLFKNTSFSQEEANSIANDSRKHLAALGISPRNFNISEGSIVINFIVDIAFSVNSLPLDILLTILCIVFGITNTKKLKDELINLSSGNSSLRTTPHEFNLNDIVYPMARNVYDNNLTTITASFQTLNGDSGQIVATPDPTTKRIKLLIALDCSFDIDQDKHEYKL